MNLKREIEVFLAVLTLVVFVTGFLNIITEVFFSILPFGFILTALLFAAVYFLRVPPPDVGALEAIFGKELHLDENPERTVRTVAHRGAGLDAPENSLAAFKLCHEKGCDSIEFDIQLSKDKVPIVFHDDNLERMTEVNDNVSDLTWEQLSKVDIAVKHSLKDKFGKVYIPKLDDAVTQMLDSNQTMIIDIKDNNMRMVNVVVDLYNKYPDLLPRAMVTTFYPNLVYLIRKKNPKIVCALGFRPYCFSTTFFKYPDGNGPRRSNIWYKHYFLSFCDFLHAWSLPRITYYFVGLSAILLHKDVISPKTILDWRNKGVRVMAWTVNTPTEKIHLSRNLKITYLTDTLVGENSAHLNQSF